jgi:hypothetical protein
MKKWITQTSTIFGLLMLVVGALQAYKTGGDWVTVAIGVISGLALLINDKNAGKGAAALVLFGLLEGSATACAGLQLPSDITASTAENVACNALYQSDCFGDVLASVGINHGTCAADIDAMINGKVQLDFTKLKGLPRACKSELKAVQEYIDTAQSAVNNAAGVK